MTTVTKFVYWYPQIKVNGEWKNIHPDGYYDADRAKNFAQTTAFLKKTDSKVTIKIKEVENGKFK